MATRNPQRIEFGQTLQRMREAAGKMPADVDAALGWYDGKARRVETGERVVSYAEVKALIELFGLGDEDSTTLHMMADAARRKEAPTHVADYAQTYVSLERQAVSIDYYDAELIPALLNTERYTRAVLAAGLEHVDDRVVADRLVRAKILTKAGAPRMRVVLGEAALKRMVGGPDVMREQIEHLVELTKLPNVAIRILPFASGAHRALGVGFTLVRLSSLTRVYIEGLTDATYIHERRETDVYEHGFEQLWALAADDEESATILRRHITTPEEHDGGETLEEID